MNNFELSLYTIPAGRELTINGFVGGLYTRNSVMNYDEI